MKKVVVIDFDGTLCEFAFPNIGKPKPDVKQALEKLKELGYTIRIHTCGTAHRWGKEFRILHIRTMEKFLEENEIPYDEIIINMDKPIADWYIDDRAIQYKDNWLDIVQQIEREQDET